MSAMQAVIRQAEMKYGMNYEQLAGVSEAVEAR
jgi:hypothetical protein